MCLFLGSPVYKPVNPPARRAVGIRHNTFTVMFKLICGASKALFRFVFGLVAFVVAILIDSTPD